MSFGARINRRLSDLTRRRRPSAAASDDAHDLTARVDHLEAIVEGLQDAVYRQAQQHDKDIGELRRQIDPAELARSLDADARRRGL